MPNQLPKVQQKAIEQIASGSLSSREYRELLRGAAEKGWAAVLSDAIRRGEKRGVLLDRLLNSASQFGRDHVDAVEVLLLASADPNANNVMEYCGPLSLPALRQAGGDIDSDSGRPLLTAITQRTKQDKALALIDAGARVDVADEEGVTALMHAAARGRNKVYDALVTAGADLYAVDNTGRSLARQIAESIAGGSHFSTESDRKAATKIARQLQDSLPTHPEDQVLLAIVVGDAKGLVKMIQRGLNPETMIADGIGLIGFKFEDLIQGIRERGGLIEALQGEDLFPTKQEQDAEMGGMSLLMWATATQQADCIRVLLEHGADPARENSGGVSALTLAEQRTGYHTIHQLLRSGIGTSLAPPNTQASKADKRCQQLGYSKPEIAEDLRGSEERFDYKIEEFPPESRGILIERQWGILCLQHALDLAEPIQESLRLILRVADELFFGSHFKERYRNSTVALPHPHIWKREMDGWEESFPIALAAASALGEWEAADKLLTYPEAICPRGDKSPLWNPEWYEWPLWVHLGSLSRGEQPKPHWLDKMKTQFTRKSKAVLATYESIRDAKAKPTQKALNRLVQAHIAYHKRMSKAVPAHRCVCPEATYFFHLARRESLDVPFNEAWESFVMRL